MPIPSTPTYEHFQVPIFGPMPPFRLAIDRDEAMGQVEDFIFNIRQHQENGWLSARTCPSRFRNRESRVRFWKKQLERHPRNIKRWQAYAHAINGYLHFTTPSFLLPIVPIPIPESSYEAGLIAAIYQAWFDRDNPLLDKATQEAAEKYYRRLQVLLIKHYNNLYGDWTE